MAVHTEAILNQWSQRLRQQGWGAGVATLIEAFEPLMPLGAAALRGGQFLLSPWFNRDTLQTITLLLEDPTSRRRFLHSLGASSGEFSP